MENFVRFIGFNNTYVLFSYNSPQKTTIPTGYQQVFVESKKMRTETGTDTEFVCIIEFKNRLV